MFLRSVRKFSVLPVHSLTPSVCASIGRLLPRHLPVLAPAQAWWYPLLHRHRTSFAQLLAHRSTIVMDMGGMEGMGGMDMGTDGPFRPTNMRLAHGLWYGITAFVGLLTAFRLIVAFESYRRRKLFLRHPRSVPSRPRGRLSQALATATAVAREASYSQALYFGGRISKHFSPLPTGQWMILLLYWAVLLAFLWHGTIIPSSDPMYAYKWEKPAFRAAWVSVSQIPFVYLLSCKFNPISLLTGISYERFNWLHRWAARTVFVTVSSICHSPTPPALPSSLFVWSKLILKLWTQIIVHWSFFFREWRLADFVSIEIQMMPMVKYGFGAWSVVGWMVFSGSFRHFRYEVFVLQHICAAATLLWLVHTHVPAYAQYNVYISIAFLAFDWIGRIVSALARNTHALAFFSRKRVGAHGFGYKVHLIALPGDVVRVTVYNADFSWRAGQHCYLCIPSIRLFELHPFTIASACPQRPQDSCDAAFSLLIKAKSGFTQALLKTAGKARTADTTYRAFLSGPWGQPPDLTHFETVVFIACGNGASFNLPQLQSLLRNGCCASEINFHWIIRSEEHFQWFGRGILAALEMASDAAVRVSVTIHETRNGTTNRKSELMRSLSSTFQDETLPAPITAGRTSSSLGHPSSTKSEKAPLSPPSNEAVNCNHTLVWQYKGRPNVETLIRSPVEAACGETAIVLCGGPTITAQARTFTTVLSDERAVHKGTGAQGIFLFCESYGW